MISGKGKTLPAKYTTLTHWRKDMIGILGLIFIALGLAELLVYFKRR